MKRDSLLQSLFKSKELLFIFAFGIIMAAVWVYLSVYNSMHKTTISPEIQQQTKPLTPTVDNKTLQTLKNRKFFSEEELAEFPISIDVSLEEDDRPGSTPTPKPTAPPVSTASAEPFPTPTPETSATPVPQE